MPEPAPLACPSRMLAVLRRARVLYADLDNTFTWKGSLFSSPDGPTLAGARALLRLRELGVELVLASGRNRLQLLEDARMMGCEHYLAELGALMGRGLQFEYTFPWDGRESPKRAMLRLGLVEKLCAMGGGGLSEYPNWNEHRECSLLLRGVVDEAAADALLRREDPRFELLDNGVSASKDARGRFLHVYHLMPRGVSKVHGVRLHRRAHDIPREDAVFVGDALTDLACGAEVGAVFIVANGPQAEPRLDRALAGAENALVTTLPCAEGVEQAVETIARAKAG